jgi:hypothetical protein
MAAMVQKRISINPRVQRLAEELQEVTGIENITELFAVLLTRYGHHLRQTWHVTANQHLPNVHYPIPITQFPEIEIQAATDPTIERLAHLLETF